ncbi:unnamed protein product [Prorocentrum cordatum]|uniref:Uncharacterized protein n=1 Tax=Prorocentrum cordatum TaxID=2364126 RepID=A0ABN9W3U9_9DINO|nr:unnamed protein product [Polarella glacialis]
MERIMYEKHVFISITSSLRAENIAVLEQTARAVRTLIGVTRTWAGPEASQVDESMRDACPWKVDGHQIGFVDRLGVGIDRTMLLQAFAVAKVLGPKRFEDDDIWDTLLRSWLWTGPSWDIGSPTNVSSIFYDSLRDARSFAGHKGVMKSCAAVVFGNDRIRRLSNRAKADQLDIHSLIAELEVCLLARFILDSSVAGASTDIVEWCDSFRQTLGVASTTSGSMTSVDDTLDREGFVRSQEGLLDTNALWE